ncbi:anthranilate synthase component I [Bacillus timonensis]|nr:anthranilate synthase component I [Bacillus timonensis]
MNTFTSFKQDAMHYRTIPIMKRFYGDMHTPIQIFQSLEAEASYILESKDEQSEWSKYSFIGLNPFMFIEEVNSKFLIKNKHKKLISKKDSIKNAFTFMNEFLSVKSPELDIPFSGGAVGYIAYDAVNTFEKVGIFKESEEVSGSFHFIICETIIVYDHQKGEISLLHYVQLNGNEGTNCLKTIYNHANAYIELIMSKMSIRAEEQDDILCIEEIEAINFDLIKSNYSKHTFIQDVEHIKNFIEKGDVFQTVLSQRFELPIKVTGFQLYRVLRTVNPSPYLFYIKIDEKEIIGSSPERLIKIDDGHLEIHPIAGTRRRGTNKEEDNRLAEELLGDKKEQAEHYMLVDLARNDIGKSSEYGSVNTPVLMEVGKFSHVMHLISKVTGNLRNDVTPIDALINAFPAGTVSGAPKVRAMQIINELEPTKRGLYAGAIAYIGFGGNIDSCITIRTMMVKDRIAYVQAGAGIVADSVPELEFKETQNKARALIQTIQMTEKLFAKKVEIK